MTSSPLSPLVLHILLALAEDKRHGYAIAQEIQEQTMGQVRAGPATLYGTLQRLRDLGWISVADTPSDVDVRRRYYRLTAAGRAALTAEVARMETIVRKVRASRPRAAASRP